MIETRDSPCFCAGSFRTCSPKLPRGGIAASISGKRRGNSFWGERDDCIFYLRYYSSPDFYVYERDRQQQYYHALIHRVAYLFRPETDLDMLMHQVFETMLAFAAHVMAGDMENNDLTTERTFEQIYSFIAPHFRAELTEGAGKETAVL